MKSLIGFILVVSSGVYVFSGVATTSYQGGEAVRQQQQDKVEAYENMLLGK